MTRAEAKDYLANYRRMHADLAPEKMLDALDVILAEQPEVDLEKEIVRFLSNSTKMNKGEGRGKYAISDIGFRAVAHHFFELGQRKAAEMYDEIEYNRQRAQEQEGQR